MKYEVPFITACIAGAFIVACTVEQSNPGASPTPTTQDGGTNADSGASPAATGTALTCLEIFDCAGK